MATRDGVLGLLIGVAVGTLFLVPAHGSAQDSQSGSCAGMSPFTPLEDLIRCGEQGSYQAQYILGLFYDNGTGVPEDDAEAVRWYRLAAEQGFDGAQNNLGRMYSAGEGVPEDLVNAYMWFNLSAAQGDEVARLNKDTTAGRMTREQIAEAQRLSREWIETHPQDGGN